MPVRGIETHALAHMAFEKINMCSKLWNFMKMDLEFLDCV